MISTKNITLALSLTGVLALSQAHAVQAVESSSVLTMKPFYAISFDVGGKRAVTYFQADNGACDLVATLADPPNWDEGIPAFTGERFEAAIPGGKSRRFTSGQGKTLEFACQAGAETMTVRPVERIATGDGSLE